MEELELKGVIQTYLEGATYADADKLRRALHEDFRTAGHFNGQLSWSNRNDAIAACEKGGIDRATPLPPWRILEQSVNGDTAMAIVESEWSGMSFLETLTLILKDGRWQIVFKAFYIK